MGEAGAWERGKALELDKVTLILCASTSGLPNNTIA